MFQRTRAQPHLGDSLLLGKKKKLNALLVRLVLVGRLLLQRLEFGLQRGNSFRGVSFLPVHLLL